MNNDKIKFMQSDSIQEYLDAKHLSNEANLYDSIPETPELVAYKKLFTQLDRSHQFLSNRVPMTLVNKVMDRIDEKEKKVNIDTDYIKISLWDFISNYKTLGIAFSICIILMAFSSGNRTSSPIKSNSHINESNFNLAKNYVKLMPNRTDTKIIIDENTKTSINKVKQIAINHIYNIENGQLSFYSNNNKINIHKNTIFKLAKQSITLISGVINCSMNGFHKGFYVNTPSCKIRTIGTDFDVTAKEWGTRVRLHSGALLVKTSSGNEMKLSKSESKLYVDKDGFISKTFPKQKKIQLPGYTAKREKSLNHSLEGETEPPESLEKSLQCK